MTDSIVYTLCNERKNIDAKTLFLIYGKKKCRTPIDLNCRIKRNAFSCEIEETHLSELKFTKM